MERGAGKGEKVGQEPTALAAMPEARQTPRGARPNRRGELARLTEFARESVRVPFSAA